MRIVDLVLGALGLTALGLMMAGAPLAEARSARGVNVGPLNSGEALELGAASHEGEFVQLTGSSEAQEAVFETGQGQAEKARHPHAGPDNSSGSNSSGSNGSGSNGSGSGAIRCCLNRNLTPAERAARAKTLERVLMPSGNSTRASFDRLRVDLLLQREGGLTAAEEREIS